MTRSSEISFYIKSTSEKLNLNFQCNQIHDTLSESQQKLALSLQLCINKTKSNHMNINNCGSNDLCNMVTVAGGNKLHRICYY